MSKLTSMVAPEVIISSVAKHLMKYVSQIRHTITGLVPRALLQYFFVSNARNFSTFVFLLCLLAFATTAIKAGELVEKGIVRVLTNVDGNENPYVFTWSDTIPNTTWACGSGCSTFYNTAEAEKANTHMERDFENCSFVITATKDIAQGEELLHVYKSKGWRTCFQPLNK